MPGSAGRAVWGNPRISLDSKTAGYVLSLLKRMLACYTETGLQKMKLMQAYLVALLYEAESAYRPLSNSPQTKAVVLVNRFKQLLFKHIKSKHRVTEYASLLHITPNHLNKVVKEITGHSPTTWIDQTLILEAKALLHQTDFPINEVAAEIGFFDQSYFSRLFKKYEGITPLAFRKMIETS